MPTFWQNKNLYVTIFFVLPLGPLSFAWGMPLATLCSVISHKLCYSTLGLSSSYLQLPPFLLFLKNAWKFNQ